MQPVNESESRIHRALSDPSRVRVLDALRSSRRALATRHSSPQAVGLHPNTVRTHLRVLAEAGLVSVAPEERHRRGRPRLVYAPTPSSTEVVESAGYRLLAEILASHLAGSRSRTRVRRPSAPAERGADISSTEGRRSRLRLPTRTYRRSSTSSPSSDSIRRSSPATTAVPS